MALKFDCCVHACVLESPVFTPRVVAYREPGDQFGNPCHLPAC